MSIADKKCAVPVLQHVIDDKFSLIKNGINYETSEIMKQVKNVPPNFHCVTV